MTNTPTRGAGLLRRGNMNATTHGAMSTAPVIHGEDPAAWQEHLVGIVESLAPVGHLEERLASRVALLLWRLDRVARFEHAATVVLQEECADEPSEFDAAVALARDQDLDVAHERKQRTALLPPADVADRVCRYESHVNRQLTSTLHELEAFQARRQGQAAPLARVDLSLP